MGKTNTVPTPPARPTGKVPAPPTPPARPAGKVPAPQAPPSAVAPAATEKRKRTMPGTAHEESAKVRAMRGTFNAYLKRIASAPTRKSRSKGGKVHVDNATRIAEIRETLARGTIEKTVPVFGDAPAGGGRRPRVDSARSFVQMIPSDKLKLASELASLLNPAPNAPRKRNGNVDEDLHAEFLGILRPYAERYGYTVGMLLDVGVPADDLRQCGYHVPERAPEAPAAE